MYRSLLDIVVPETPDSGVVGIVIIVVLLLALVGVAAYFIVKKIKKK